MIAGDLDEEPSREELEWFESLKQAELRERQLANPRQNPSAWQHRRHGSIVGGSRRSQPRWTRSCLVLHCSAMETSRAAGHPLNASLQHWLTPPDAAAEQKTKVARQDKRTENDVNSERNPFGNAESSWLNGACGDAGYVCRIRE